MSTYADKISLCEMLLDYTFENRLLCLEALQTSGNPLIWAGQYRMITKNDRLAILGDTLLKSYLCTKWFEAGRTKGEWATAEQAVIRNTNLARVGFDKGLENCIILNPGTAEASDKTMATTVEALIGAVYRDTGETGMTKLVEILRLDHGYLHSLLSYPCSIIVEE